MAVYTQLNHAELAELCKHFDLGQLVSYRGIEDGIENSTYFLDFECNHQVTSTVLTIFEYTTAKELPFFIQLTTKLADLGLDVPCPLSQKDGSPLLFVGNKPALLYPRALGGHVSVPTIDQCAQIGAFCAQMHAANDQAPSLERKNERGLEWMLKTADNIYDFVEMPERELIDEHFLFHNQQLEALNLLPSGVVHCDLFHDNALFHEGSLSAVIDFYFSCTEAFMVDLAIVANDWCWSDSEHGYNAQKLESLIRGYSSVRKISLEEQRLFNLCARVALMRFWLSRREDEIRQSGRRLKSAFQLRHRLEYLINHPADISEYC